MYELIILSALVFISVLIGFYDAKTRLIPYTLSGSFGALSILYFLLFNRGEWIMVLSIGITFVIMWMFFLFLPKLKDKVGFSDGLLMLFSAFIITTTGIFAYIATYLLYTIGVVVAKYIKQEKDYPAGGIITTAAIGGLGFSLLQHNIGLFCAFAGFVIFVNLVIHFSNYEYNRDMDFIDEQLDEERAEYIRNLGKKGDVLDAEVKEV